MVIVKSVLVCGFHGDSGSGVPKGEIVFTALIQQPLHGYAAGAAPKPENYVVLPGHGPGSFLGIIAVVGVVAGGPAARAGRDLGNPGRVFQIQSRGRQHGQQVLLHQGLALQGLLCRAAGGSIRLACLQHHPGLALGHAAGAGLQDQAEISLPGEIIGPHGDLNIQMRDAEGEEQLPVHLGVVSARFGGSAGGFNGDGDGLVEGALPLHGDGNHAIRNFRISFLREAHHGGGLLLIVRDGHGAGGGCAVGGAALGLGQDQVEGPIAVSLFVVYRGQHQIFFGFAGGKGQLQLCSGHRGSHNVGYVLQLLEHVLGGGDPLTADLLAGEQVPGLLYRIQVRGAGKGGEAAGVRKIVQRFHQALLCDLHALLIIFQDGFRLFFVL